MSVFDNSRSPLTHRFEPEPFDNPPLVCTPVRCYAGGLSLFFKNSFPVTGSRFRCYLDPLMDAETRRNVQFSPLFYRKLRSKREMKNIVTGKTPNLSGETGWLQTGSRTIAFPRTAIAPSGYRAK